MWDESEQIQVRCDGLRAKECPVRREVMPLQRLQGTRPLGRELDEGYGRDPEGKHTCKSQSEAQPAKGTTRHDKA